MVKTKPKRRSTKSTKAGREIRAALQEVLDASSADAPMGSRFNARTYELPDMPGEWAPASVQSLRNQIGASQAFFGRLIGASPTLIQAWEQGKREPNGIARRLLDFIKSDPQPWLNMARAVGARTVTR